MNCHLAITRVKFVYLIDACVLRRKLNRRFHNKRRRRGEASKPNDVPFSKVKSFSGNNLFRILTSFIHSTHESISDCFFKEHPKFTVFCYLPDLR